MEVTSAARTNEGIEVVFDRKRPPSGCHYAHRPHQVAYQLLGIQDLTRCKSRSSAKYRSGGGSANIGTRSIPADRSHPRAGTEIYVVIKKLRKRCACARAASRQPADPTWDRRAAPASSAAARTQRNFVWIQPIELWPEPRNSGSRFGSLFDRDDSRFGLPTGLRVLRNNRVKTQTRGQRFNHSRPQQSCRPQLPHFLDEV